MVSLWFQFRLVIRVVVGVVLMLPLDGARSVALSTQPSRVAVVFLAQTQISDALWSALFQSLREDLVAGIGEGAGGVALDPNAAFLRREDFVPLIDVNMIEVQLLGRCDGRPQVVFGVSEGPLGWVERVDGEIRPFISIDCARLAQVLHQAMIGLNKAERERVMTRAIAHVLIHEWIHIATQSTAHRSRGIMQSSLSVSELIASPPQYNLSAARCLTIP